ncbi:fibrillin-2-like [Pollicipes pollicipes]|uniref:fibrillin-2-like n=1 Tax=Pollicipes pollicipes TaxID=41117 RepID=UPI001884CE38|nr:fibrillin-2-like [Pollicipes pollicipes]
MASAAPPGRILMGRRWRRRACVSSSCSFGCQPSGGAGGVSCGCPQGYQSFGQGHCISTISPAGGGWSSQQTSYSSYQQFNTQTDTSNVISTEGCFSCKINGKSPRGKRSAPSLDVVRQLLRLNGTYDSAELNEMDVGADHQKSHHHSKHHHKKHHHKKHSGKRVKLRSRPEDGQDALLIQIQLSQTRKKTKIIRLQPALKYLQHNVHYSIASGNEAGRFLLLTRNDITSLHFVHRQQKPGQYDLVLTGNPIHRVTGHQDAAPFRLPVRILVVE